MKMRWEHHQLIQSLRADEMLAEKKETGARLIMLRRERQSLLDEIAAHLMESLPLDSEGYSRMKSRTPILRKSYPKRSTKKIPRKTWLKASTKPIPPKNAKRRAKNWKRAYGSPAYVEWVHQQPCIACGVVGFSGVAHVRTGGMGRKADANQTVPLCGPQGGHDGETEWFYLGCHRMLHALGRESFEKWKRLDLDQAALDCESAWQKHQEENQE